MPVIHPVAVAHELRRWMRPDAHRFVDPRWRQFVKPGSDAASIFSCYEAKYRSDQPRVPAGVREGGQWTTEEGAGGASRDAAGDDGSTIELSAASRKGGGHHPVSRGVTKNFPLSEEAMKVFEKRTTGPLHDRKSNEFDVVHRQYNDAVDKSLRQFLREKQIDPAKMTEGQANEFYDSVMRSCDQRIRNLNMRIYMREIMLMIRRGRAGE